MNEEKKVVAFQATTATSNAILTLATSGKAFNAQLESTAETMAREVEGIEGLDVHQKVALLNETYAAALAILKPQKDTMAKFNALLFCKVAGEVQVEIAPPSKDGKIAAVFKPADKLTATEAKRAVSEVRQTVRELEESPTEKAAREKKEDIARMAKQVIANKMAQEAAQLKAREAFAYVLHERQRDELVTALGAIGLKLVKIPTAPAKK